MRKPTFRGLRALVLMLLSVPFCHASILQYDLTFTAPVDGGAAPTGSFTYNTATKTFLSFDVEFRGIAVNFLESDIAEENPANNPSITGALACLGGSTGGEATFLMITGECETPIWRADEIGPTLIFTVFQNESRVGGINISGREAIPSEFSPILLQGAGVVSGNVTASLVNSAEVPEPALALPLVLLLGVLARKRARRAGSAG